MSLRRAWAAQEEEEEQGEAGSLAEGLGGVGVVGPAGARNNRSASSVSGGCSRHGDLARAALGSARHFQLLRREHAHGGGRGAWPAGRTSGGGGTRREEAVDRAKGNTSRCRGTSPARRRGRPLPSREGLARASTRAGEGVRRSAPIPAPERSRSRGPSDSGRPDPDESRRPLTSARCLLTLTSSAALSDPAGIFFQPDNP
nr:uncharacterized protein LOC113804389 [Penaeus vannamei]